MSKIWDLGQFGNLSALIDEFGTSLTYSQLNSESTSFAEKLSRRCFVFCLCRNEIGSVLGYISFINNGIVPVLLNSNLDKGLLKDLLTLYEPPYLWLPKDMTDKFSGMECVYETYGYSLLKTGYKKEYSRFSLQHQAPQAPLNLFVNHIPTFLIMRSP